MNVKGNACSHTPHSHTLKAGVDSRCEACQNPIGIVGRALPLPGIIGQSGKTRTWREGSTRKFPSDGTVRVH